MNSVVQSLEHQAAIVLVCGWIECGLERQKSKDFR